MANMVRLAEIAKRLRIDRSTVRRLIAKEGDSLQLTLHRGKHDRLFLSSEDAEKLIASYEPGVARLQLRRRVASPHVLEGYSAHKPELEENWQLARNRQPLKPIEPLE
jgi:hypothetical protein